MTESIAPVPPKAEPTKTEESESDSEDESVADGDLAAVSPGLFEECKLVSAPQDDLAEGPALILKHLGPSGPVRPRHDEGKDRGAVRVRPSSPFQSQMHMLNMPLRPPR